MLGDTNGSINNILKVDHPEIPAANSATGEVIPAQTAYRYYGADPNNYVYYNCTDNSNTATCEVWRIIGLFNTYSPESGQYENRVKIKRQASIGTYSWDSNASTINSGWGINEWSQANLKTLLNSGAYWNRTTGTCYNSEENGTTPCDFSSTGLTSGAKALTERARYYTGGISGFENVGLITALFKTAEEIYLEERGNVTVSNPSDYGYASGEACAEWTDLNTDFSNSCAGIDWLNSGTWEWTLSPISNYVRGVGGVDCNGYIESANASFNYAVSPVLYLKLDVMKIDGTGTSDDPYVIG